MTALIAIWMLGVAGLAVGLRQTEAAPDYWEGDNWLWLIALWPLLLPLLLLVGITLSYLDERQP